MKKEGVSGKNLTIGFTGYVGVAEAKLHTKIAASKKESNFHDLLQSGWKGRN